MILQTLQLYRCFWPQPWHRGAALCLVLEATTRVSGCTSTRGNLIILLITHSTFSIWQLLTLPAVTTGQWSIVPRKHMAFQSLIRQHWMTSWRSLPKHRIYSIAITCTIPSVVIRQIAAGCAKSSRSVLHLKWNLMITRAALSLTTGTVTIPAAALCPYYVTSCSAALYLP